MVFRKMHEATSMDENSLPETIYENEETTKFNQTPNRKRTPLTIRNRRMRPTSPSNCSSPSSNSIISSNGKSSSSSSSPGPSRSSSDYGFSSNSLNLPMVSPRCVINPFETDGVTMSPSVLEVASNIGTPNLVKNGGWTLEQQSVLFPAPITDEQVDSQYQSTITNEDSTRNASVCQEWLQQTDLTSPWTGHHESYNKLRFNKSKSFGRLNSSNELTQEASTQTNTSLPPDFNLFEFLEKHGAAMQTIPPSREASLGSANSSLRRKLFEGPDGDSEEEEDDEIVPAPFQSPTRYQQGPNQQVFTPQSEQFSSSPIKISPVSNATSPGALSTCGGGPELFDGTPFCSPFRSPFGNEDICLSPIPKDPEKSMTPPLSRTRRLLSDSADISKHLTFKDMESNGNDLSSDSDLDETALEEAKNAQKVRNSSLNDENLDCSMKSEIGQSWDVSAIIKSEDKNTRETGHAESTHIQSLMHSQFQSSSTENEGRLNAIKDDENVDVNIDDDVCMDSVYGDSRGFSFEASEFFQDNSTGSKSQGEGLDSGFGSNSNQASRSEVKLLSIPIPVIPANSVEDMVEK